MRIIYTFFLSLDFAFRFALHPVFIGFAFAFYLIKIRFKKVKNQLF